MRVDEKISLSVPGAGHNPTTDSGSSLFAAPVASAIREEKKLRAEGASFWDSFRRISARYVLLRILTFPLSQLVAFCWQMSRDKETIRPRDLRRVEGGNQVYGGTVQRNKAREGLQDAIEAVEESLESINAGEAGGYGRNVPTENSLDLNAVRFGERPLGPYLKAIVDRSAGLLCRFAIKSLQLENAVRGKESSPLGYRTLPPKVQIDEETQEVLIEITGKDEVSSSRPSPLVGTVMSEEVTARMVVRLSFREGVDVRVVAIDARKEAKAQHSLVGNSAPPISTESIWDNELPEQDSEYPFYTALSEAYGMILGGKELSRLGVMRMIQEGWERSAKGEGSAADSVRQKAFKELREKHENWTLRGENPGTLRPEGSEITDVDLPITSVMLQQPVVVSIVSDTGDRSDNAIRYDPDGRRTEADSLASVLGPWWDKEARAYKNPLVLRRWGDTWVPLDSRIVCLPVPEKPPEE